METLFDIQGRACARIYDDNWIVAYTEAKHLGWLSHSGAVHDKNGQHIGWFTDGVLQDASGKRVADIHGTTLPGMAGIPGMPGMPGFSGISFGPKGISSSWSATGIYEFFGS